MNKKGFELSINMIIIIILAVVTLGVALTIINRIPEIPEIPIPTIEPTADNPISFLPLDFERGKDNGMGISFYNNEQDNITDDVKPWLECEGIDNIETSTIGLNIPIGEWKTYEVVVSIPRDTPTGKYSCKIIVSKTEESFFMTVK